MLRGGRAEVFSSLLQVEPSDRATRDPLRVLAWETQGNRLYVMTKKYKDPEWLGVAMKRKGSKMLFCQNR